VVEVRKEREEDLHLVVSDSEAENLRSFGERKRRTKEGGERERERRGGIIEIRDGEKKEGRKKKEEEKKFFHFLETRNNLRQKKKKKKKKKREKKKKGKKKVGKSPWRGTENGLFLTLHPLGAAFYYYSHYCSFFAMQNERKKKKKKKNSTHVVLLIALPTERMTWADCRQSLEGLFKISEVQADYYPFSFQFSISIFQNTSWRQLPPT